MTVVSIIGAGFSGAVIARQLAEAGCHCHVMDERHHVAGNCHTERDDRTGIMVHRYGPHIFHTSDEEVWRYVSNHAELVPYRHRVMTTAKGRVYSLPINLLTINQFYGTTLDPEGAAAFVAAKAESIPSPANFEEQALSLVGREMYETFFRGYTAKQWGLDPTVLPASILKRLPLRFNYDDSYFAHRYQAIPRDGYTPLVESILRHPNIEVSLGQSFTEISTAYTHTFYTGPIDRFFGFRFGRLPYRTLDFETVRGTGDIQGIAVMNYADEDVPQTRITEHKHFAPWERHELSIAYVERSRQCGPDDTPYYPIRMAEDEKLLADYVSLARSQRHVTFVGRLGTYAYLDMDVAIKRALETARTFLACKQAGQMAPAFVHDPL